MDWAWLPNMFLDKESCDVDLQVHTEGCDQGVLVPVHSLVLKQASRVFKDMLKPGRDGRPGLAKLNVQGEMNDAILFLRYVYTRELEHVDLSVYVSLLKTAHLYEVDSLVYLCNKRIAGQLTPLSVCRTYRTIESIASDELLNHCRELMLRSAFLIFMKNLHLTLKEDAMEYLFSSDNLNIINEEQALGALWRWGCTKSAMENHTSNMDTKQHIAKLLPSIRWPLINDVKESAPWFCVWKENKMKVEAGTAGSPETLGRKADEKVPLSQYAEVCCLYKHMFIAGKFSCIKQNSYALLMFTVDRDILLSGLELQVTVSGRLTGNYPFRFYFNQRDITKYISSSELVVNTFTSQKYGPEKQGQFHERGVQIFQDNYYVYELKMDFLTPFPVRKSDLNNVSMLVNANCELSVELPDYFPGKTFCSKSDHSPRFSTHDHVKGGFKLYYFL